MCRSPFLPCLCDSFPKEQPVFGYANSAQARRLCYVFDSRSFNVLNEGSAERASGLGAVRCRERHCVGGCHAAEKETADLLS